MKMSQVALQVYSIREHVRTSAEFAASMRRVRAIGYEAVQIAGVGPIPASEIYAITSGEGLTICGTHTDGRELVEQPARVVETLGTLRCTMTSYPYPHVALETLRDVERLAESLNRAGAVLKAAGIKLSYHNHDIEFRRIEGKTLLEWIYEKTEPSLLAAELDTYWVQAGGSDVVGWCTRMVGRLPGIHLKDYAMQSASREPICAALGDGNLDFSRIVSVAEEGGCKWFIVEQERGFDDVFVAIETSYRFLKDKIAS